MGKREDNRKMRHGAMLDVAVDLFAKNGIENTRLEDVAKLANVSPATFYNYFPTKGHLVGELYTEKLGQIFSDHLDDIADAPLDNPVDAVVSIFCVEIEDEDIFTDRNIWRELYSTAISTDNPIKIVDPFFPPRLDPFKNLLQQLQEFGSICKSADISSLSEVFACLNEAYFLSRLLDENPDLDHIKARLRRNIETILRPYITA